MSIYKLNLKAFLEGRIASGLMSTLLNSTGLLPLTQPYNNSPWAYPGAESVVVIPNVNVVDWILVELRQSPTGAAIDRRAGFILNTGVIVDLDGVSPLEFISEIDTDYYFVVVYHRNHLAIMSSIAIDGSATLYDFTSASSQAYGTNPMKNIIGAGWAMFTGDADANGIVDSADQGLIFSALGSLTYNPCDVSLDGVVNATDRNQCKANLLQITQVP